MSLAIGLILGAYVLIYSGIKGANPLDVLTSAFTGKPVESSLASRSTGLSGGTDIPAVLQTQIGGKEKSGILRVNPGVQILPGTEWVYWRAYPAALTCGGNFEVISWYRPGSRVHGTGSISEHAFGEAIDIRPIAGKGGQVNWARADALVAALHATLPTELIFRGDPDHDPGLGANPAHVHCGYGNESDPKYDG